MNHVWMIEKLEKNEWQPLPNIFHFKTREGARVMLKSLRGIRLKESYMFPNLRIRQYKAVPFRP